MTAIKSRPDDIANPTISEVMDLFLDEQHARLAPKTYANYDSVIGFFTTSLNNYAYNTLDRADGEKFDRMYALEGDDHREFCEVFGPEHILPNVGEFLDYFMVRKVIVGKGLLRAAGTVTKKLAKWLGEHGYSDSDDVADAVDQGASAARDLPAAEELAFQLDDFAADTNPGGAAETVDDRFMIQRVEPGKIWVEGLVEMDKIVPIKIPRELTGQCKVGWSFSGTVGRFGRTWGLMEVWNVYPS